jgi:hypothetical protein
MELRAEIAIDAPARSAWALLGERFGDIGVWAAPITSSTLEGAPSAGACRVCHTARFGPFAPGVIEEELVLFDSYAMTLAYRAAAGLPRFISSAENRWSVHEVGERRCVVRAHAKVALRGLMRVFGFLLVWRLRSGATRTLEELKHYVEHGRPHPRKLATAAKLLG